MFWLLNLFVLFELRGQSLKVTYWTNSFDLNGDGVADIDLHYINMPFPNVGFGDRNYRYILLSFNGTNEVYSDQTSLVNTNKSSQTVKPFLLSEATFLEKPLTSFFALWGQVEPEQGGIGFYGPIADNKALVFGFKLYAVDGAHFAWARVQGTNGNSFRANLEDNFDTNKPPVFSEVTINPVPYAAIQVGQPSPGGPTLAFERQPGNKLRLSYPDWGPRYVIRQRALPKGLVTKVYPGGRKGIVATNGVYSVDVPLGDAQGFFELYLPPENVAP